MRFCFIVHDNASLMRASLPSRYLMRDGHEVHMIVIRKPGRNPHIYGSPKGLRVHMVEKSWGCGHTVKQMLDRLEPEIVHSLAPGKNTFLSALKHTKTTGAALVVDIDEWLSKVYPFPKNLLIRQLEHKALREADVALCCSIFMHDAFAAMHPKAQLGYLANANDLEFFDAHRDRASEVRAEYNDRPLVTYLGTMLPQYQADTVLDIAALVHERRPDAQFLMVGGGPLRESLAREASGRGMDEYLRFTGFVPDEELPGLLCASSALLFPIEDTDINRARCPNKTFLFAAAQVPIITNSVGEVARALGNEALYFPYGDWACCADLVVEALQTGEPKVSRATAEAHSWETRTRQYLEIIAPLMKR